MPKKRGKGSVGEGETGKKAKATPQAAGKSVSEKSQATSTSKYPFEKSCSQHTEYFVRVVKDKRTRKNGAEFLIGWLDFPLESLILQSSFQDIGECGKEEEDSCWSVCSQV